MAELSPRDWEALSAYLDGRLSPRERARLEARLAREPALRQRLAELRALRAALRDLPPPRVPRNFTLRPEMVRPTASPRRGTWWRWATALTALLLVLVVLADWGLGRMALQAAAPPEPAKKPAVALPQVAPLASPEEGLSAARPSAGAPTTPPAKEGQALGMAAAVPRATATEALRGGETPRSIATPAASPTPRPTEEPPSSKETPVSPWRVVEGLLLAVLLALLVGRRWLLGRR